MDVDPATLGRSERYALFNGLVTPRPIAWVSSLAPDGVRNLAPFSFFGAVAHDPPTIVLGPGSRAGVEKDTLANVRATGELVVNLVDRALVEVVNACSGEWAPEVDEWEVAGVTPSASTAVAPARVAEAPAALECRVRTIVELEESTHTLVVATVVRIHVRDDAVADGVPDAAALDLVARLGGDDWCTTRDRFSLRRPGRRDPDEVAAELRGASR